MVEYAIVGLSYRVCCGQCALHQQFDEAKQDVSSPDGFEVEHQLRCFVPQPTGWSAIPELSLLLTCWESKEVNRGREDLTVRPMQGLDHGLECGRNNLNNQQISSRWSFGDGLMS